MSVHVFLGPTLASDEVRRELPTAEISGPAAFGDVYRAAKSGARAIVIIDGYFERVPAVWHKEILWAMAEGVHVFGAASMGALRAAELADFGMQGVGSIYEAYRNGALEDDDEVAVAHAPGDQGYVSHSEPMVNVRATVIAAVNDGVIKPSTAEFLLTAAKRRFYAERSYSAAIRDAAAIGAEQRELAQFSGWLPRGRIDQKADDARSAVRVVAAWLRTDPKRLRASFRFERTDAWLEAMRAADAGGAAGAVTRSTEDDGVCDELKLAGRFRAAYDAAAARAAAIAEARRASFRPDPAAVLNAAETFRRDLGLVDREAFERWREDERVDDEHLTKLFEEQACVLWAQPRLERSIQSQLADALRVRGEFGRTVERAERKARRSAAFGPSGPTLADVGLTESELWHWYFVEVRGEPMPSDLYAFARQRCFEDVDELRSAVLRERFERAQAP